jgi:RNA-directed DNA polymerase
MNKAGKADNLHFANYPQEVGVEPQGMAGELSFVLVKSTCIDKNHINTQNILEQILERDNLNSAFKRVKQNKGSHGVDGMTVDELLPFLKQNGDSLKSALLSGRYKPKSVRRIEIPKADGGKRLLGIPTVTDRLIQQAIAQVLQPIFEKEFSEHSYGFRPSRSAHHAITKACEYINEGYRFVVDIDLEKFFDRVNHDILMHLISKRISDTRVLRLIRSFLKSGVMADGFVSSTDEGTPQGGPLSPLLSNIMLHELDRELETRGHRFCRYADDCNIYVKSRKAGERVMESVTCFIEKRLKLKVNQSKSAVDKPSKRKFLGFSFYYAKGVALVCAHRKSLQRIESKIKHLTNRSNAMSVEMRAKRLSQIIIGWVEYFKIADMRYKCRELDKWMRRRIRMCIWKQWKKIRCRHDNLVRLGIANSKAWEYANTRKGYWRIAKSPVLSCSLTNEYLKKLGFRNFTDVYNKVLILRTAVCRTARTVV